MKSPNACIFGVRGMAEFEHIVVKARIFNLISGEIVSLSFEQRSLPTATRHTL